MSMKGDHNERYTRTHTRMARIIKKWHNYQHTSKHNFLFLENRHERRPQRVTHTLRAEELAYKRGITGNRYTPHSRVAY